MIWINELKKISPGRLGRGFGFSIHFCFNISRQVGHFNFGFRV